jgi:hypothetical protein
VVLYEQTVAMVGKLCVSLSTEEKAQLCDAILADHAKASKAPAVGRPLHSDVPLCCEPT